MKYNLNKKTALVLFVLFSGFSAVYLQFHANLEADLTSEAILLEACLKEGSYLPDVHLVKEILRSIFNVVNA